MRFVTVDSTARAASPPIASGEAHVGAGGCCCRPRGSAPPRAASAAPAPHRALPPAGVRCGRRPRAQCCGRAGYYAVEPVLIYNSDGFKPAGWRDLDGETVAYREGDGLDADVAGAARRRIRRALPARSTCRRRPA